jgi:hypothetical protein
MEGGCQWGEGAGRRGRGGRRGRSGARQRGGGAAEGGGGGEESLLSPGEEQRNGCGRWRRGVGGGAAAVRPPPPPAAAAAGNPRRVAPSVASLMGSWA